MLTRKVRIQVVLFILISAVGIGYLSYKYLGAKTIMGGSSYQVKVHLPDGGGMFTHGEVTFRGVPIGRVGKMRPTPDGMEAVLRIDGSAPAIPADVEIVVANRSAIGEQFVDLRPRSDGAPFLKDGAILRAGTEALPPSTSQLLLHSRNFARSVPEEELRTVVDEMFLAFRGTSEHLRKIFSTSQDFIATADSHFLMTQGLIQNSGIVLTTQENSAESIRSFSRDLKLFASTLKASDSDLRALISSAPAAAREMDALFRQVGTPLGLLMSNLVTPAQIFGTYSAGVEDAMINAPQAFGIGKKIVTPRGLALGLAQNYSNPLGCTTGYGGTELRKGSATSDGKPLNTKAGCTTNDPRANVRGPKSIPALNKAGSLAISTPSSLSDLMGGDR